MNFAMTEMLETIRMVQMENLDIRTITMGINLRDCADSNFEKMKQKVYDKITALCERFEGRRRKNRERIRNSHH